MKKFNVHEEKISVKKSPLMQAINRGETFAITHHGEVLSPPYSDKDIFIFKGALNVQTAAFAIAKQKGINDLFGQLYKIEEQEDTLIFDVENAWGEIVGFNQENATYDDTTSDGIMDLGDSKLEEMSWHATEFGISNRDISDVIESQCEGTLFCLHKESPFLFSSLIFVDDMDCARDKVEAFIKEQIAQKIANDPDFDSASLTDDEEQAARFFAVI